MMSAAAETHPILPPDQTLGDVTDQIAGIPLHFPARRRWLIALAFASALLLLLLVSVTMLFTRGVGIWGVNIPITWAFAIHNYVWWLGIGHAGTLISALLLLTGSDWRNSLMRRTLTSFLVVAATASAVFVKLRMRKERERQRWHSTPPFNYFDRRRVGAKTMLFG